MSSFLGPIHVKMYNRILYQDAMSQALLALAEEKGWENGLRNLADTQAPAAAKEPLEKLIDQNNIHGWLNEAVAGSERRFAFIAGNILAGHPERLGELQGIMKNLGQQNKLPAQTDAEHAFQVIHDILLDGMPCDFPFDIAESGADTVAWQVTSCPHAPYWQAEKCDAQTYYLLRDAWVEGMLEGSNIKHTRTGFKHTLQKEQ